MLHKITHASDGDAPAVYIVHGLYGSARNWGAIGKALSNRGPVIAIDQRNHGHSPWFDSHSYEDMASDLAQEIDADASGPVDIIGHSMGGKAAMVLALTRPDLVRRMIVADIAPMPYTHSQMPYIDAMRKVDLSKITRRSEAEVALRELVDDPTLASFFTLSLDLTKKKWRLNLDVLAKDMPNIMDFPAIEAITEMPVLFLSGGNSDYVQDGHRETIRRYFPKARFVKIPGAGHWLHAEKPQAFEESARVWLDQNT
ncbi:MAG: alpha/beta fold hydrolase [Pseudomonadota bacterium]